MLTKTNGFVSPLKGYYCSKRNLFSFIRALRFINYTFNHDSLEWVFRIATVGNIAHANSWLVWKPNMAILYTGWMP